MKLNLLAILLITSKLSFSQIGYIDPYYHLNIKHEPKLFTQEKILENGITELVIRNYIIDQYDSTELRTRYYERILFNNRGFIESIQTIDSAQVFDKSKEKLWGKIKIALGQKKNMINEQRLSFFYNSNWLVDSSYYWENDDLNTDYYYSEMTNFGYDQNGKLNFQKKVNHVYWSENSKYNDTNIYLHSIKYIGPGTEYDTIIDAPEIPSHIGYISPQIEIGDNGFVKRITKTTRTYSNIKKAKKQPSGVNIINEYTLFHYDENDRIKYISILNSNLDEIRQERFFYSESGLILKKVSLIGQNEIVFENYTYKSSL